MRVQVVPVGRVDELPVVLKDLDTIGLDRLNVQIQLKGRTLEATAKCVFGVRVWVAASNFIQCRTAICRFD